MRNYGELIVDRVVDCYDGDSIRVNIKSLPLIIGDNIGIRVKGVDCPEIRGKSEYEKQLAISAREFTERLLREAVEVKLINVERDKYFRILATVLVDGQNLAESLIAAGLGRVYNGGTRQPWAEENL